MAVTHDEILYAIDLQMSLERQGLNLQVLAFKRKQDGSRGALRQLRITRGQASHLRDPQDRALLSLLSGAMQGDPWSSWYLTQHQEVPGHPWVPNEMAQEVARRLCATGRCHFRTVNLQIEEPPLTWDDGPPWELWLAVREDAEGVCEVVPELRRGDLRLDARERIVLAEAGLLVAPGELAAIDTGGAAAWLRLLSRTGPLGPLRVPAAEREDLLEALFAAPVLPRLDLPASMRYEEATVAPRPQLRLLPPSLGRLRSEREWPIAKVSYLYDRSEVKADSGSRGVYQREERRFFLRDLEAEEKAVERLAALGFRAAAAAASNEPALRIAPKRVPQAVRTLIAEGWSVEAQGKIYRTPGAFTVSVASGVDWFELHGDVEFEGERVDLPRLLAALKKGEGFVPLSDGSVGLLPEKWLERWAPLAGLAKSEKDHLRFELPQALLLDAWLADEPAASSTRPSPRPGNACAASAASPPPTRRPAFCGELRPYQRPGSGWLHFLRASASAGCLADDMGLGKTVQVLALLEARREERRGPGLPPRSSSSRARWCSTGRPRRHVSPPPSGPRLHRTAEPSGRAGAAHRSPTSTSSSPRTAPSAATSRSSRMSSSTTWSSTRRRRSRTPAPRPPRRRACSAGDHRLALSGTPVENHLGELWRRSSSSSTPACSGPALGRSRRATRASPTPPARAAARAGRSGRSSSVARKHQVAPRAAGARRADARLRARRPAAPSTTSSATTSARSLAGGIGDQRASASRRSTSSKRCSACARPRATRASSTTAHADERGAKLDALLPQLARSLAEGHKALVFSQFTSSFASSRHQPRGRRDRLPLPRRRPRDRAGAGGARSRRIPRAACS